MVWNLAMIKNDTIKLTNSFLEAMLGHFKDLIEQINKSDDEHISCVLEMKRWEWPYVN